MNQTVWDGHDPSHITRMINLAYAGDAKAKEELLPMVYQELKAIAAKQRGQHAAPPEMLNTTAIVNEAWLRLRNHDQSYENRNHFLAVAATAMRQLLIDEARRHLRQKRGSGEAVHVTIGDKLSIEDQAAWLVSLDHALTGLGNYKPRLRDVFQLRFFVGLTDHETAEVLSISESTVRRDWTKAKAMLAVAL